MKDKDSLINPQEIVFAGEEHVIRVDDDSLAWGEQALQAMEVGGMGDFAKAQKICDYLHDNFAYNFQRRIRFPEIIQKNGVNCVSHTLGHILAEIGRYPYKIHP